MRLIVNHRCIYSQRHALTFMVCLSSFFGVSCSLSLDLGNSPKIMCTSDRQCEDIQRCQGGRCLFLMEVCDTIDNDQDNLVDEMLTNACGQCGDLPIELCDGIDNDCDGTSDEDFNELGQSCVDHESGLSGQYVCHGDGVICTPENIPLTNIEVCDAVDNDEDGQVDEELALPILDCGPDSCRITSPQRCVDGALVNDCLAAIAESDITCDGFDDDCDLVIDEDVITTVVDCGETCGVSSIATCEQGMIIDQCSLAVEGLIETCDGIDNDCDNLIDEEIDQWRDTMESCGLGVCQSTLKERCGEGVLIERCSDMPNIAESEDPQSLINRQSIKDFCDAKDNDCDGLLDEDSSHDLDRCSSAEVEGNFRSIRCQDGERTSSECGFFDILCQESGEPFNPLTCDEADADLSDESSVDTDGDGIDGEANKSFFVHPLLGDDTQTGTRIEPLQSLSEALERVELAQATHPNETPLRILLSIGTYEIETTIVGYDLTIVGGYMAVEQNGYIAWTRPPMADRVSGIADKTIIRTPGAGPLFLVNQPTVDLELDALELQIGNGHPDQGEEQRSSLGLSLIACDVTHLREVKLLIGNGANGRPGISPSPAILEPSIYRGADGTQRGGGEGGQNLTCCPNNECSGGRGGIADNNGHRGNPLGDESPGNGGLGGFLFGSPQPTIYPAKIGQAGGSGENATFGSLFGAINLTSGGWVRLLNGESATVGHTGGGGGGGAGLPIERGDPIELDPPGGGGGGGAGGCGGQAGTSGESGGWSIGITLSPACHLSMEEVLIVKGQGGDGGISGAAGSGQIGGEGGLSSPISEAHQGGRGGEGGCGGHGVSGHGGMNITFIFLMSTPLQLFGYTVEEGLGGQNGEVSMNTRCEPSQGARGIDGFSLESLCCPALSANDPIAPCSVCSW